IYTIVITRLLPYFRPRFSALSPFSRKSSALQQTKKPNISWRHFPAGDSPRQEKLEKWICLAPIWTLPQNFSLLLYYGVRRIVALSSTSRFTKEHSSDEAEKIIADKLAHSEQTLAEWAQKNNLSWTILRPTLIYGLGRDKNISVIIRFIRRFSFFPLLGKAQGLRQPVHAQDVALACVSALNTEKAANRAYNIPGGETLTYRQMVEKVFESLGKRQRFVVLPLWIFRAGIFILRHLPRLRDWSAAMAERMNQNLVFDNLDARKDFNFAPREFELTREDLSGILNY
ncbi:MAG TPA: NAD-dependent epimerase/dehydratase family protein, partial [Deltaproteobacteria bacterium]|nr:NAD-dependent epimerase/dehydratase family protein [Deltaproteobacteria bacterium]